VDEHDAVRGRGPGAWQLTRLALLSALILFVEMLLIRWVGTELRVFAYLQNAVLVAAFLGLGLGCRSASDRIRMLPALAALCVIELAIFDPFRWAIGETVTHGLSAFQDSLVWETGAAQAIQRVRTALVFFAAVVSLTTLASVAFVFHPLGQWLGRIMDAHPRPIAAYSANVLGSLLGILAFVSMTALWMPPWLWLAVACAGLAVLAARSDEAPVRRGLGVALAVGIAVAAWHARQPGTIWSPYQKLAVVPLFEPTVKGGVQRCGEKILVNGTVYQLLLDLDPAHMAAEPLRATRDEIEQSHYFLPYRLIGVRERVLVVGAGAGNDVAAALRAGARSVHAVEIDPAIASLGRLRHPNRPYSADGVRLTVDDARAVFRNDRGLYDLVWFGLLDSHTNPSAYTNLRLDHFVYTRESLLEMKARLAPGGVVVLFFQPQASWLVDRLAFLLRDTFSAMPLAFYVTRQRDCLGPGGLLLVAGERETMDRLRARAAGDPLFASLAISTTAGPSGAGMVTDDWPYLYLPARGLPRFHLLIGMLSLGLGLAVRRRLFRPGQPVHAAMGLLGIGFMLVETLSVSRAALLYGTTWTVNAYVIGAVLCMVLLANLVASRVRFSLAGWPLVGLVLSLLCQALLPMTGLVALPLGLRILAGAGFLALPVFFSGLVFVRAWSGAENRDLALGSNLLGSLLGGVASMASMIVGFRALLLVALAVYLAAALLLVRQKDHAAARVVA
jgi:SAM-dependent methyltransferase